MGGVVRLYLAGKRDDLMLVPDEVRKCVAFLWCNVDDRMLVAGTGFFVGIQNKELGVNFVYFVTAKHVIEDIKEASSDQKAIIRLNRQDGEADFIHTDVAAWTTHRTDTSADVAVINWVPSMDKYDYKIVSTESFAGAEWITARSVGPGDEVFLPGLFTKHSGRTRNLPIVRAGSIAAMPEEPIHSKRYGEMDAYLIEARSISGLSGSPVFVHLVPGRTYGGTTKLAGEGFRLLGLVHGHWDSLLTEVDGLLDDTARPERVNMGIAVVVPCTKIAEVLEHPLFVAGRAMAEEEIQAKKAPTPDTDGSGT